MSPHLRPTLVSLTGPIVFLLCFFLPNVLFSMQLGSTEGTTALTLNAEYDDNINLSSGTKQNAAIKDDILLHVIPAIDLTHSYLDHAVHFNLTGDYRKGTDSNISDINTKTSADIALNFPGGLSLGFFDLYTNTTFDQQLDDESGLSDNRSNRYEVNAAHKFGVRLRAEGRYEHTWKEFDDQPDKRVYDTDTVEGRVTVPVSTSWEAYITGFFETLDSEQAKERNRDDRRSVLGLQWSGAYRFSLWLEGGYEQIDYEASEKEDFAEPMGEIGGKITFTPRSSMSLSLGKNGYGNLKYAGLLSHNYDDKLNIQLSVNKDTNTSFSTTLDEDIYERTKFQLALRTTFMNRFLANFIGSYQVLDYGEFSEPVKTWLGKMSVDYPIQGWIKVGGHYQYSFRKSDHTETEYDNNRIGLFVTFSI
ncbi:MAG: hypothetical protein D3923_00720 [Candidatus Electrothrix sp. AR3]|nr:hypothetical protein [Candidatus Electrothrix sp. AR3]